MGLILESVEKRLGSFYLKIGIQASSGELLSLLGPSGCGKTTALRIIAGLVEPERGKIILQGKDITHTSVHLRNIGMVFQDNALFPHLSVAGNIGYGPKAMGWDRKRTRDRIEELLFLVGLQGYEGRRIENLSGGEQQRVALARSLAVKPDLVLLDEPLSSLDAALRKRMRKEIRRIQQALSLTVIFVTHDQEEAFAVSDKIAVIRDGRVEQIGAPKELYEGPINEWTGSFVGTANTIPGTVEGLHGPLYTIATASGRFSVLKKNSRGTFTVGDKVTVFFRPQHLFINEFTEGTNTLSGKVKAIEYYGKYQQIVWQSGDTELVSEISNNRFFVPGERITWGVRSENIILFKQ